MNVCHFLNTCNLEWFSIYRISAIEKKTRINLNKFNNFTWNNWEVEKDSHTTTVSLRVNSKNGDNNNEQKKKSFWAEQKAQLLGAHLCS